MLYLRLCLAHSAGVNSSRDSDEATLLEQAPRIGSYIRSLLQPNPSQGPVATYVNLLIQLLLVQPGNTQRCVIERNHVLHVYSNFKDPLT